jgi:TolA-binding protein
MNFQEGKYRQAALSFEEFLSSNRESKDRAQALFHLGMSRALANDSSRDLRRAEDAFKRLVSEFPDSPYAKQAEFILGLQAQIEKLKSDAKERDDRIKRLSEELQKLKEIDMQRRPSRPAE